MPPAVGPRLEPSVGRPLPERESVALQVVPCDLKTANEFVRRLHRHSRPVVGHKFAVAVAARMPIGDTRPGGAGYGMHMDCIVGVAIVGRPVAPRLRLACLKTPNAQVTGAVRRPVDLAVMGPVPKREDR